MGITQSLAVFPYDIEGVISSKYFQFKTKNVTFLIQTL